VKTTVSFRASTVRRVASLIASPAYCWRYGLQRLGANYFVRDTLNAGSVVIDCGLGCDADFSEAVITRYGCHCYGIDPTRKHQEVLAEVASRQNGRLHLHPLAVAGISGTLTFHEPVYHVSGSLYDDHRNTRMDAVSYSVPAVTIEDLMTRLRTPRVGLLKMDIEGAEYDVLAGMRDELLCKIDQMIVEFHHHCVSAYTLEDTKRAIARLISLGFRSYSVDAVNYLFFRH
jgi:FkbM family methyltransferase